VNLNDFDRVSSLILEIKSQIDATDDFLLQILVLAQHVSGITMPIIRSSRVLYRWLLPVVFGALVFKLSVWCGTEGYVSGLRAASLEGFRSSLFLLRSHSRPKVNAKVLFCSLLPDVFKEHCLVYMFTGFARLSFW
jgi:hypothetical protein